MVNKALMAKHGFRFGTFEERYVALHMISVCYPSKNSLEWHSEDRYLGVQLCYFC
jgi:hypothetical protein